MLRKRLLPIATLIALPMLGSGCATTQAQPSFDLRALEASKPNGVEVALSGWIVDMVNEIDLYPAKRMIGHDKRICISAISTTDVQNVGQYRYGGPATLYGRLYVWAEKVGPLGLPLTENYCSSNLVIVTSRIVFGNAELVH